MEPHGTARTYIKHEFFIFRSEIRQHGRESYFVNVFPEVSSWSYWEIRGFEADCRQYHSRGGWYFCENHEENVNFVRIEYSKQRMTSRRTLLKNNIYLRFSVVAVWTLIFHFSIRNTVWKVAPEACMLKEFLMDRGFSATLKFSKGLKNSQLIFF